MSQMKSAINRLEFQEKGRLSSQPEVNSRNVSAMTLKKRKEIEGPKPTGPKDKSEDQIEKELEVEGLNKTTPEIVSDHLIKVNTNHHLIQISWSSQKGKIKIKRS